MPDHQTDRRTRVGNVVLIAGIILIAVNLRPSLAAIGPLVGNIRDDLGLSNAAFGLLTTLPLLGFGIVSAFTPLVTRRIGVEWTLAAALLLLAAGILLRVLPSIALLYAGTGLIGISIALGNVLLPTIVKRDFPKRQGVMTGAYSSAMGVGAMFGAGISAPMLAWFDVDWRGSLAAWAVLAVAALLVWAPQLRQRTLPRHTQGLRKALQDLGRSRVAWYVALFMGLQSLTFYVILAWLPDFLVHCGFDVIEAGWLLALSQGAGIFGTLFVPAAAARSLDQRRLVWMLMILEGVALIGFLLPSRMLLPLWISIIGFVLGGSFGLALLFIVLRATNTETATELSGMSQSTGYLIAATGPTFFGFLYDLTLSWATAFSFLIAVLVIKLITGLGAARPRTIRD